MVKLAMDDPADSQAGTVKLATINRPPDNLATVNRMPDNPPGERTAAAGRT